MQYRYKGRVILGCPKGDIEMTDYSMQPNQKSEWIHFSLRHYGRSPVSRPVLGPNSEDGGKKTQENEQVVKDQRSQWEPRVKKPQSRCKSGNGKN